jgi:hypothetical protein
MSVAMLLKAAAIFVSEFLWDSSCIQIRNRQIRLLLVAYPTRTSLRGLPHENFGVFFASLDGTNYKAAKGTFLLLYWMIEVYLNYFCYFFLAI